MIRWLFRPRGTLQTMAAAFLLYNPLLAAAFAFTFHGTTRFLAHWSVTLTISNVMTLQCFAVVTLAQAGMRRIAKRQLPWLGAVLVSLASMPVTLPIAYRAGGYVANGFQRTWSGVGWQEYRIGIAFGLVVMAVYFLQQRRTEAREAELAARAKIQALENAQLKAQVSALTAEMNPHLLFNALNTVAALIHDDPNRAEDVIVELSSLYRQTRPQTNGCATARARKAQRKRPPGPSSREWPSFDPRIIDVPNGHQLKLRRPAPAVPGAPLSANRFPPPPGH